MNDNICEIMENGDSNHINTDCPICLVTIDKGFTTSCGHTFCISCLVEALTRNPTCPLCRKSDIHTCNIHNDTCSLCIAGHNPDIVTPNVFLNDDTMVYSPFIYMSAREKISILCKLSLVFSLQLFAAYQCFIRVITLWCFCLICLISTIISMMIVSHWSPMRRISQFIIIYL